MNNLVMIMVVFVVISTMNLITFFLALKIVQKVYKKEDLKIPNPVTIVNEIKEEHKRQKEQEELEISLYNVEVFDGTGLGQKSFDQVVINWTRKK